MAADRGTSPAQLTVLLCFLGAICEGFDVQAAGVAAGGTLFAGFLLAAGQSPSRVLMGVLPLVVVSSTVAGLLGWQDSRPQPS